MNILDIAKKKNNGKVLSQEEIEFCVTNFYNGKITKEQMTIFLKSVYDGQMTDEEIYFLTKAIQKTGETCDMSVFNGKSVDKHSTGGVADTTTLILAPILASLDIVMLKASGRSLGWTGGTVNKLECFDGYKCDLEFEKAVELARKNGACLVSQSKDLAPADKVIYALRDETGLVDNTALIASSIMSKKLAANNDYIFLDIKVGKGAFMPTLKKAENLARVMVKIAKLDNKKCVCFITDMNQPLGDNIGSYMEAVEAIEVLNGKHSRLSEIVTFMACEILQAVKGYSKNDALNEVNRVIYEKVALNKFKDMIKDGKGKLDLFDAKTMKHSGKVKSNKDGYIKSFKCKALGNLSLEMEKIDKKAGIICYKKIGDRVKKGDLLFKVVNFELCDDKLLEKLGKCVIIDKDKVKSKKLIYKVLK